MAVNRSLKRWLHVVGSLLGLLGVLFVCLRLYTYSEQIDLSRFNIIAWSIIGLMSLAYGAANVLLARAWFYLLAFLEVKVHWRWVVKAYGLSQLAKYLPGNIFHLAGRQALGMAAGLPARPLIKSVLWELGLIAVAGITFGVIAVPLVWPKLSLWLSAVLFLVMTAALFAILLHRFSPSVAGALVWQMGFFVVSGTVFIITLAIVVPRANVLPALPALYGAYVLAWLAGLVTPGAPAGVGVREMVLLFLLGGKIAEADLLLAVVLGRGVTVLGDLLFFIAASALKNIRFDYI